MAHGSSKHSVKLEPVQKSTSKDATEKTSNLLRYQTLREATYGQTEQSQIE
jgi:hypothetical protein